MRTAAAVAASIGACFVLAACASGSTGTAGPAGSTTADTLGVWRQSAVCARAHGVPALPDPQLDSTGRVTFPGYDKRSEPLAVATSCGSILDQLPPDTRPNAAPTDISALLRFAQCMRQHGQPDWPDPKADGTFPANQLPTAKTPAVVSGMQACDHLNPDGAGYVYGS